MKIEHKKTMKLFSIILVVFTVFFGAVIATSASKGSGSFLTSFSIFAGAMVFAWAVVWVTQIGIIKLQFNGLVKKYYPELYSEVKV